MGCDRKYSVAGPIVLSPTPLSLPPFFVLWCPVPCTSLFWLIVVFIPPPSCLLLPPSHARPFVAICPGRCRFSPSQRVATSCRAVAIVSNSKLPLIHHGWLSSGLSSHHHLLMHRGLLMRQLVVVSPISSSSIDATSHCLVDMLPPLIVPPICLMIAVAGCCVTSRHAPAS